MSAFGSKADIRPPLRALKCYEGVTRDRPDSESSGPSSYGTFRKVALLLSNGNLGHARTRC
jgi:hypothetical protein